MIKLLQKLSPEFAHDIAKVGMKMGLCASGELHSDQSTELFGVKINNPFGLAAGFDKNAELVKTVTKYGFGWVEVGSITNKGGNGNPKPRMFRLEDGHSVMNRMGLNGLPAWIIENRLRDCKHVHFAVNIAKTHDPEIVGDLAIDDMMRTYERFHDLGIYNVINISCPNTKEGKTFEDLGALKELLDSFEYIRSFNSRPMLLKLSPNFNDFDGIVKLAADYEVAGFVACNTMPLEHKSNGRGGASGRYVKPSAISVVKSLRERMPDTVIIGCGGIFSAEDVIDYHMHGANFFQAYNGFVRGPHAGSDFVKQLMTWNK